jgi:hypothetical protein
MLIVLFIYGSTRSLQFTSLGTLAYADVDDKQKAAASTLWSVAQQMTIGMGIAFGAVCLRIATSFSRAESGVQSGLFALRDFRWAFIAAGLLILVAIAGYARLSPDAGNAIAQRR